MSGGSGSGSVRETAQVARYGALLFGAATVVSALGLVFPHQEQADDGGLTLVVIAAAAVSVILAVGGNRLALWAIELAVASGTVLIALSLVFNGERDGGAAGGDEVYFLWIALFCGPFLQSPRPGAPDGLHRGGLRGRALCASIRGLSPSAAG